MKGDSHEKADNWSIGPCASIIDSRQRFRTKGLQRHLGNEATLKPWKKPANAPAIVTAFPNARIPQVAHPR